MGIRKRKTDDELLDNRVKMLQEISHKFSSLMSEPHPRLMSWLLAVGAAVTEINAIMAGDRD